MVYHTKILGKWTRNILRCIGSVKKNKAPFSHVVDMQTFQKNLERDSWEDPEKKIKKSDFS